MRILTIFATVALATLGSAISLRQEYEDDNAALCRDSPMSD